MLDSTETEQAIKTPSQRGRPFQPGNKLGRGRPKRGSALADFLRFELSKAVSDEDRRTRGQQWAEAFVKQAIDGDVAASREILARVDGPVKQQHEISGPDGGPLVLQWPRAEQS